MHTHLRRPRRPHAALGIAAALTLVLGACSGGADEDSAAVRVGTGVYAFEWLAEQVGGERLSVTNVVPSGADAHSLELAPAQVARLERADLIVHLPAFQAPMDEFVAETDPERVLDAAVATRPVTPEELLGADHDHTDEHEDHEDHGEHDHGRDDRAEDDHAGHSHGPLDPHVWLDPDRMVALAEDLAERLTEIDPDGAETYAEGLRAVTDDLTALHEEIHTGLASCEVTTVVVGHRAYGYLLAPHGFTEQGLAGLDGGTEVSPARIAELSALVADAGVSTIYRDAGSPDDAVRAVAEQTGTEVAVLDPVELPPAEGDYLDAMRANIAALTSGQRCG